MKFIQSVNENNQIINLDHCQSIQINPSEKQSICFSFYGGYIYWNGSVEEIMKDWKTITDALNNDVSSLQHTIK